MGHRALIGGADRGRVAPQRARLIVVDARLPPGAAIGQDIGRDVEIDGAGIAEMRTDTSFLYGV